MTHEEKRIYLIKELLAESSDYSFVKIPCEAEAQKKLLRSLMNIRMPKPVSDAFLRVQDEYLTSENRLCGIVDAACLAPAAIDSRISLWQGDITTLKADAIVNAANSSLLGCFIPLHSCIDNIIHSKSGIQLRLLCSRIINEQGHEEPVGTAKITPGFNLCCKYILHTVGPMVKGTLTDVDCSLLASCYRSCLSLACEYGCKTVAFCCISTGIFRFPNDKAAQIAVSTVKSFLETNTSIQKVVFNVFNNNDLSVYKGLLEGANENH